MIVAGVGRQVLVHLNVVGLASIGEVDLKIAGPPGRVAKLEAAAIGRQRRGVSIPQIGRTRAEVDPPGHPACPPGLTLTGRDDRAVDGDRVWTWEAEGVRQ